MKKEKDILGDFETWLPGALISWYAFKDNAKALFVSGGFSESEVLFYVLKEKNLDVDTVSYKELDLIKNQYDYIVMAGVIEKCNQPENVLKKLKSCLKHNGQLLIGTDNRLAIKYFCGDKDYFSNQVFDGIDNYRYLSKKRLDAIGGRLYSLSEIKDFLSKALIDHYRFYSVLPDLLRPQMLVAEGYKPNELLEDRIFPQYKNPSTIFLEEEKLYSTLLENNIFHQLANGYLIVCSNGEEIEEIDQVTVQGDRLSSESMATIIKKDIGVSKKLLFPTDNNNKIQMFAENQEYLKTHNVQIVEAVCTLDSINMPYISEQIATEYFVKLLCTNKDKFIQKLEEFRNIILNSSDVVPYEEVNWQCFEPGWKKRKNDDPNIDKWQRLAFGEERDRQQIGAILKRGYLDMVSLNCFGSDEGFKFFDQEFYIDNFPANAIFIRTVDLIYRDDRAKAGLCTKEEVLKRFNLDEHETTWRAMGEEYLSNMRNEQSLTEYHRIHRRDFQTITSNRHRMNYSQEEYNLLFTDIFRNLGNKKVYLFGSGAYAQKFIDQFSSYCNIVGAIDNNEEKWGETIQGIPIMSPEVLLQEEAAYKVYICIKYYDEVLQQLKEMGIKNIAIYDPRLEYARPVVLRDSQKEESIKPYHTGYIAGVFDLYHIGHLNMFKRAKEQCEYLIVGIVSDEQVMKNKKTCPVIPFDERVEIIRSCKYVDEVVEIPANNPDTEYAYRTYHFDVQFSGSDYADDPIWLSKQVYLRQHGSDLVFFPYTETTSSTQIKGKLKSGNSTDM